MASFNDSHPNIQKEYLKELQQRSQQTVGLESGFLLLIDVFSLIGNLVICWAMFKNPRLHTVTNLYILSLAIADVFMAMIVMPASFGVLATSSWPFGSVFCNIQGSVVLILAFVSSLTIGLMALNRYFRVVKPISYRTWFTVNKSVFMILMAWGLVLLFVLLPVVTGWAFFVFRPKRSICFMRIIPPVANITFTAIHLFLFVVLPMITILACYFRVFMTVKRHSSVVAPSLKSNNRSNGTEMTVEEINITKLLFAIVVGFLVCWIPVLIIEFINTSLPDSDSLDRWVYLLYNYLWYISSAINPIIYGALNKSFRSEAARVLPKRARKHSIIDENVV